MLRVGVACWNGLAGPSYGADADARNYHTFAGIVARGEAEPTNRPHGFVYARALGQVYRLTGQSLLVGSLISCAAWLASALALLALMQLLSATTTLQAVGTAVYAMLPSSVLWTSVTLREPYQLLFMNLILFTALKILVSRSLRLWPVLLLLVGAGSVFHAVILVAGVLVAAAVLAIEIWRAPWSVAARSGTLAVALAGVVVIGMVTFASLYRYDFAGGPSAIVARLAEGGLWFPARTLYRDANTVDPIVFGPIWLAQYLFEPMPWRMSAAVDWVFVVENAVRLVLIVMMIPALRRSHAQERTHVMLIVLSYLSLEALWSLATFNWGTAARHHLPTLGLLIAGAVAYSNPPSTPEVIPSAIS
jgi:hypothetical protein